ncbi:TetR/AcrR family transcriptional regulator [Mycolicibacterium madagascariense]|uniref:TetR/AcrR family transcriptional regulator n=1 Tax=Mycolicibacterium madagascariense TaxID=212765 RepID=UPI0013D08EC8|nr:TetR/AcrR family transcriptional regulator [Mycolicibacterium madagascariense]MCV7014346.1 TetR/AcrR family transcriptional regulator [Mycolicibacterium madagascariense]
MTASSATTGSSALGPAGGRAPRVTKRRAQTRAKLLAAAFRVFADKGFGMVRIDDVCSAAGYTRGAFYSQFDSLDELFFTLYDERAEVIAGQVSEALLDSTADVSSAIERVTETLLLDRDWLLVKTDFLLYAARHPDTAERLAAHRSRLRDAVEHRLNAVSDQLALPAPLRDTADAARAVVAAYDGVAAQLLLDGDLAAARAWLTQLLAALLNR